MFTLIKSEWRLLLFGFLMTFWSSPGQTYLISLFSGEIRGELGLTDGEFGGIYSLATLLSAIVLVWSGTLADKTDLKKFSFVTVFGLTIGCGFMSVSAGVASLIVSIFLLRHFGQGLMCIASSTSVVRYLDRDKGKSTAIAGMGYAVSETIMPSIVVGMLLWLGWRHSWQVLGLIVIIFMIPAIWFLLQDHDHRHNNYLKELSNTKISSARLSQRRQWTRAEVLRDKRFYMFIPGLMSQQLMFTGFIFHQVHLVESKNWSLTVWASLFAMYAMVSVITKIVTGFWVDRYGAIPLVPVIALPMGVGLIILALSSSMAGGGLFLLLTGITVGLQTTVTAPFWSEMYGSKHLGSIKSLGASFMVFSTAISPFALGWFIDRGTSMETLATASAIYILATSLLAYYASKLTDYSHGV